MPDGTSSDVRTYVLVHGAWFGGWVWKDVAARLRAMGHSVLAPSLTGLGDRKHLRQPGITLGTHVTDIVNLIELEDLNSVTLVGWSYGGSVVTDVLARIPERIGSMVYLDAVMPERGRCHASYSTVQSAEEIMLLAAQNLDIPPLPVRPFGIDDESLVRYIEARVSPHPALTMLSPSTALLERPKIPHTYVLAGRWAEVSQTFSRIYTMFREQSLGQSHVLDVGHVMMLTHPELTAEVLDAAL
jgi:pimeloyl-ACP methyl ester carboxylesterase